jgi:hypothetical protein
MKKIIFFMLIFLFACSTTEEEQKPDGFGELIREGYPTEINPFLILKKTSQGLVRVDAPTIIAYDADDYLPVIKISLGYVFSLRVPAKYYTEEEYLISLRTLTKDFKKCSEAKEVMFYRFAEENGIAEYRSLIWTKGEGEEESKSKGVYLYLAQREMPSYEGYHVLKVCSTEKNKGFRLEGEVIK